MWKWIISPMIAAIGIVMLVGSVLPFVGDARKPETLVGATWPLVGIYIVVVAFAILVVAGFVIYGLSK